MSAAAIWTFSSKGLKANFCPECGSLLDLPGDSGSVVCQLCEYTCSAAELESKVIVTSSKKENKGKGRLKKQSTSKQEERATVDEVCTNCGNQEMLFTTAQLRSADEGQTIFYECPNCGYKFTVNS